MYLTFTRLKGRTNPLLVLIALAALAALILSYQAREKSRWLAVENTRRIIEQANLRANGELNISNTTISCLQGEMSHIRRCMSGQGGLVNPGIDAQDRRETEEMMKQLQDFFEDGEANVWPRYAEAKAGITALPRSSRAEMEKLIAKVDGTHAYAIERRNEAVAMRADLDRLVTTTTEYWDRLTIHLPEH